MAKLFSLIVANMAQEHAAQAATGEALQRLVEQVGMAADTVSATSQSLAGHSRQAKATAEQVALTISQLAQGAGEQSQELIEGAQRTGTLNLLSHDLASHSRATAEASAAARQAVQSGQDALQALGQRIEAIHRSVVATATTIEHLGTLGDQIGSIIDLIKGIAAQTNLLALNAAIEAARAGEQGRGFAVVANEVRQLAAESTRSAQAVTEMVGQIQQETRGAVAAMRLAQELEGITASMAHVAAVAEEAAAGAGETTSAAREQFDATAHIAALADSLAAMAQTLQQTAGTSAGQGPGHLPPVRPAAPQPYAAPLIGTLAVS